MMTVKTTNIQNRDGRLYFRIRVPEDCQTALGGKREVKKSLALKADDKADQGKAITQVGLLAAEWNETFDRIRNSGNTSKLSAALPGNRPLAECLREQVFHSHATLELEWFIRKFSMNQCEGVLEDIKEEHDLVSKILDEDLLDQNHLNKVCGCMLLGVRNTNIPFNGIEDIHYEDDRWTDEADMHALTAWTLAEGLEVQNNRGVLRSILRALRDELKYIAQGIVEEYPRLNLLKDWSPMISRPSAAESPSLKPAQTSPAQQTRSVSDVLDECFAATKRTKKNEDDIRSELRSFLDWHGLDGKSTPVTDVTVAQMIDYRDNCLSKLPTNANKKKETKTLTLRKQIAYGQRNGLETISITTINTRLMFVARVFSYAKKKHYIPIAIGEGLKLTNPTQQAKLAGNKFDGYSDKQMADLVAYIDKNRPLHKPGYEWRYWIPLLLAYTGCRANEICMLRPDNIKQADGIWYADLHNDASSKQRVKNMTSIRHVPICKRIVDLGFIEYVDSMRTGTEKQQEERRLWNTLTYCEKNHWLRKLSRYFNKTVRPAIGASDVKSGLHGLRSSVSRELQRKKVDQRTIDELTGHQPEGISQISRGYQGRLSLKVLQEAVDKLDWPPTKSKQDVAPPPKPAPEKKKPRRRKRKTSAKKKAIKR